MNALIYLLTNNQYVMDQSVVGRELISNTYETHTKDRPSNIIMFMKDIEKLPAMGDHIVGCEAYPKGFNVVEVTAPSIDKDILDCIEYYDIYVVRSEDFQIVEPEST